MSEDQKLPPKPGEIPRNLPVPADEILGHAPKPKREITEIELEEVIRSLTSQVTELMNDAARREERIEELEREVKEL